MEEITTYEKLFKLCTNEVIEDFLQKKPTCVHYKNSSDETIFHLLAKFNRTKILKNVMKMFPDAIIDEADEQGNTPFLNAALEGNKQCMVLFKNQGADVTISNTDNATALHFSTKGGHLLVAKKLISWNVEINTRTNSTGETPLILATKGGHDKVVDLLLKSGADSNIRCNFGRTALWYAVLHNSLSCCQNLLNFNADVNIKDNDKVTSLMVAAKKRSKIAHKILKLLLTSGADFTARCKNRRTALHYAAFNRSSKNVQTLLRANSETNLVDINGRTPLMSALYDTDINKYREKIVICLLHHNASPNIQCKHGRSALHYAASNGHLECCTVLRMAKAFTDLKDNYGNTPLMLAATKGYLQIVEFLLKEGADLNIKDNKGKNVLMGIASNPNTNGSSHNNHLNNNSIKNNINNSSEVNFEATIVYLIDQKININARSNRGLTALHYASLNGYLVCVIQLLNSKTDINATDKNGETALHKAARQGYSTIITLLLRSGADESIKTVSQKTGYDLVCKGNHTNCKWIFKEASSVNDNNNYPQFLIERIKKPDKPFTEKERLYFIDEINYSMDKALIEKKHSHIEFKSINIWNGKFLITAAHQDSKIWLLKTLGDFNRVRLVDYPPP